MNEGHADLECCLKLILVEISGSRTGACKDRIRWKSLITDGESGLGDCDSLTNGLYTQENSNGQTSCDWWIFLSQFHGDCQVNVTLYELVYYYLNIR